VGLLGGAQKLVEAVGLLPQALMLSVLPALSLAAETPGRAARTAGEAARVLVIVVFPAAATLELWAEPVLTAVLGAPFGAAAPVLRLLAPLALLNATGSLLTNLLVAMGLQRLLLRVSAVAATLMVGLAVGLVPGNGPMGAAMTLVVVVLAGQVGLVALPATRAHVRPPLRTALRPVGLGVLTAAALVAAQPPLVLGLPLLVAGYAVALLATGTVTRADLARWRM
jgi:O-antigen/teichoic acid export membrane protein